MLLWIWNGKFIKCKIVRKHRIEYGKHAERELNKKNNIQEEIGSVWQAEGLEEGSRKI